MLCRAKVNLTLHVGAPIPSGRWAGYHPVDSLVVFADMGDVLDVSESRSGAHAISVDGPFGEGLSPGPDNLVTRALEACGIAPRHVRLTKNIPVSAGLGGGSANAAGVLRLFDKDHAVDAAALGADVPVCRLSQTAMMRGIGERVDPVEELGQVAAVLVNPRKPVSTATIFREYDATAPDAEPHRTSSQGTLLDRALSGRNDLQDVAARLEPSIGEVLHALQNTPACRLARMSGSGATCFGLYDTLDAAKDAASALEGRGWWVQPALLGDAS
jgi:4-diphosphocytidyl-2-C-methyl-D-erythritol kinase